MPSRFRFGDAPQREFTARRVCPGLPGEDPHATRWWRWIDPDRQDGCWHCCTCDYRPPESAPLTGLPTEMPVTDKLPHGEVARFFPLVERDLALAA